MNEIRKSFRQEGIRLDYYDYRDSSQNEIDLVYIRDGALHRIEIESGTKFTVSSVKGFIQRNQTRYIRGTNALVCTSDKLSALSDGTLVIPAASI